MLQYLFYKGCPQGCDWSFLTEDAVMFNRVVMIKSGVRLGEVTLGFRKLRRRRPRLESRFALSCAIGRNRGADPGVCRVILGLGLGLRLVRLARSSSNRGKPSHCGRT